MRRQLARKVLSLCIVAGLALGGGLAIAGGGKPPAPPAKPEIVYVRGDYFNTQLLVSLYVMDADGSHKTLLKAAKKAPKGYPESRPDTGYSLPSWSPDKKHIVVLEEDPYYTCSGPSIDGGGGPKVMKVLDIAVGTDGVPKVTGERTIVDCNDDYVGQFPAWSNDGLTIAYIYFNEIRTVPADGSAPSSLLHTEEVCWGACMKDLTWSPDSKRIAYTVDESRIEILDVASGIVTEALPSGTFAQLNRLDWSHDPAGRWILFKAEDASSPFHIYRFDPTPGAAPPEVVCEADACGGWLMDVAWSTDDSHVVFACSPCGSRERIWDHDTFTGADSVLAASEVYHFSQPDM